MVQRNARKTTRMAATMAVAAAMTGAMTMGAVTPALAASESAIYHSADANNNGTLSRREFRTFINLLAADGVPIAKRVRFWRVYGTAFRMTDKDGNGEVTPAELRASERNNRNRKFN